jgi:renalase
MHDAIVVGGGISGVACAQRLSEQDHDVLLLDRGRRLGGRMATRTVRDSGTRWDGHVVDIGASYFTVSDADFRAQVEDWSARGLARPWTDAFHVANSDGISGVRAGPMRYASPYGLRSLVEDLGADLTKQQSTSVAEISLQADRFRVDELAAQSVALCMPVPQAQQLWPVPAEHVWEPVIVVVAVFEERCWIDIDGVFVNDDPVLTWIADDGRRRGDGAAVLVAHVNPVLAARHLNSVTDILPSALGTMKRIVQIDADPVLVDAHRWTFARPITAHSEPFWRDESARIGVSGDAWFSGPRIETAWLSGRALADAIA